jgi:hypothetical protein
MRSPATERPTSRDRPGDDAPGVRRLCSSFLMNCPVPTNLLGRSLVVGHHHARCGRSPSRVMHGQVPTQPAADAARGAPPVRNAPAIPIVRGRWTRQPSPPFPGAVPYSMQAVMNSSLWHHRQEDIDDFGTAVNPTQTAQDRWGRRGVWCVREAHTRPTLPACSFPLFCISVIFLGDTCGNMINDGIRNRSWTIRHRGAMQASKPRRPRTTAVCRAARAAALPGLSAPA